MPIDSIRRSLHELSRERFDHPGLALARYLNHQDDAHEAVRMLHKAVQASAASEAYRSAFARWRQLAQESGYLQFTEKLGGPLAVGLGSESVTEVGLTTHFTYGVPVIPGSAVKGLCRRGALLLRQQEKLTEEQFLAIFGDTKGASFFTFWDAWYDPGSVGGKPFHRDVITVHHPEYYGKKGKEGWPTDFDDPTPVPFLVVKPGAQFLFTVQAPDAAWGAFVQELVRWSLRNLGAGGKTNAGYGWFDVKSVPADAEQKPETSLAILWRDVVVRRRPNDGELSAMQGDSRAYARGPEAERLMNELPEEAREKLRSKKRELPADIEVKPQGNSWQIVKIVPKG
jgi:CRISPR-associated protein Cmr6